MSSVVPSDPTPYIPGFPSVSTRIIFGQWVYPDGTGIDTPPTIEYGGAPYFLSVAGATLFTKKITATLVSSSDPSTRGVWYAEVLVYDDPDVVGSVSVKISHPLIPAGITIAVPSGGTPLNVANALPIVGSTGGLLVIQPNGQTGSGATQAQLDSILAQAATDATNKANTARVDAINAAALDATSKASAAQTAATTAASSDATNKANTAQTNATNAAASALTAGLATKADLSGGKVPVAQIPVHTSALVSDFVEAAQDAVNALLVGTSGVTLSYDDAANSLTITGSGTGQAGGLDAEAVRDAIGVALLGSGMVSVVVNDAADTITITGSQALTDALAAKAPLAAPAFTGTATFASLPTVPTTTPTTAGQVISKAALDARLSALPSSSSTGVTFVDKSQLGYYVKTDTRAVKQAAHAKNLAAIRAAYFADPTKRVVIDRSGGPVMVNLELNAHPNAPTYADGFVFTNSMPVNIEGLLCPPKGDRTSKTDTLNNPVIAAPALRVVRRALAAVAPTSITTVTLGGQFNHAVTAFGFASGGAMVFAAGDVTHLSALDGYEAAERAGFAAAFTTLAGSKPMANDGSPTGSTTTAHKGIVLTVQALLFNVTGYSLSALNTAEGRTGDGLLTSVERRTVFASGGTSFVVQGDTGTGQLLVNSLTAEPAAGETLRVGSSTGPVIGTVASLRVISPGILDTTYLSQPWLRKINSAPVNIEGLEVVCDGSPDDVVAAYNRPEAVVLEACTDVRLGTDINGGYASGVTFRTAYRVSGRLYGRDLANHALAQLNADGSASIADNDEAYGYLGRFIGACAQVKDFVMFGTRVRHVPTTNMVGGTYNQNAYTGAIDPATCSNWVSYGPGLRDFSIEVHGVANYGQTVDTHEGAQDGEFFGTSDFPSSAGKGITGPDGAVIRGHNITLRDFRVTGARTAVVDGGPAIASLAGKPYVNRFLRIVADRCQLTGFAQGGDAINSALARSLVQDCIFRADPKSPFTEVGMVINAGITNTVNVTVEGFEWPASHNNQGDETGRVQHVGLIPDYRDTSSNNGVRAEDTFASIDIVSMYPRVNPGSSQRPNYHLRNMSGDTAWRVGIIMPSFLGSNTTPPKLLEVVAGSPTVTQLPDAFTHVGTTLVAKGSAVDGATTAGTVTLLAGSDDHSGTIIITAGTGTLAAGTVATVTFAQPYYGTPTVTYSAVEGTAGQSLSSKTAQLKSISPTGFSLEVRGGLTAGIEYRASYRVEGI